MDGRHCIALLAALASMGALSTTAPPVPTGNIILFGEFVGDITIDDTDGTDGDGGWYDLVDGQEWSWRLFNEDDEVEPTATVGQDWDLEGFFMGRGSDGGMSGELYLISGYDHENDPVDGTDGCGHLFFDIDGFAVYGTMVSHVSPDENGAIPNNFGYDAVAIFDFGTGNVSGYCLDGSELLLPVDNADTERSNPWRLADPTSAALLNTVPFTYTKGLSSAQVGGLSGETHNVLAFNIYDLFQPLSPGSYPNAAFIHYTMRSGNDNLMGDMSGLTIPNPTVVADAGPDQKGYTGATIWFDGSGSWCDEGGPESFLWEWELVPPGSQAQMLEDETHAPYFSADMPGLYAVKLTFTCESKGDDTDFVTAYITNRPVANAGPDQSSHLGVEVTLDGSGSNDADGDDLSFAWSFSQRPAGSTAALDNPALVAPSFTIDLIGDYVIQLIVNDGTVDSDSDTVVVRSINRTPVADAGPDQSSPVLHLVTLDGTGSYDPDGHGITFTWSFVSRPAGSRASLADSALASTQFTSDVPGVYHVTLVVSDPLAAQSTDTLTVLAVNTPPVAMVEAPTSGSVVQAVCLDGSRSSDPDGHSLTFAWSLATPEGSTAALSDSGSVSPTFTPDLPGEYVVELVVHDGFDASAPASARIDIMPVSELSVVYVDFAVGKDNNSGATPAACLCTLAMAQQKVQPNGRIILAPGATNEILTLDKPMRIEALDGPASVGVY